MKGACLILSMELLHKLLKLPEGSAITGLSPHVIPTCSDAIVRVEGDAYPEATAMSMATLTPIIEGGELKGWKV